MMFDDRKGESRLDYIQWLFNSNKRYIRNLLLLYVSFHPIFTLVNYYTAPDGAYYLNIFTFLGIPFLLLAYVSTYIKKLIPYIRIINASALLAMNLNVLLGYAFLSPEQATMDAWYSALMISLATFGLSMSSISIVITYICIVTTGYISISVFIHHLHINDSHLFYSSLKYIIEASAMYIIIALVIEQFSLKLYKAQKRIAREKNAINDERNTLANLNKTKDRFFRIISHDLRSPFTTLIGYFDVLLRNTENEFSVEKEDINKIYLQSRRTYNLLNNLLNWSQSQLNEYSFKPKPHKLKDIFTENDTLYLEIAKQKKIKVLNDFNENASIFCDKEMIATIVRNLIFNSIKFTKPNGYIYLTGKEKPNNTIEIGVADTGIGMTSMDIDKILQPNVHFTRKGTHNEKGAGIGLLICNDLLKKHNSALQIESTLHKGSKFFFILPTNAS